MVREEERKMAYDIDKINQDNPTWRVVSEVVDLKKNGTRYVGRCPFHDDKSPSLVVYDDHYHCFGCDAHGDTIDFVMRYHGTSFPDACKILGGELKTPSADGRVKRAKKITKSVYDGITPVLPVPTDAPLILAKKKTPPIYNPNRENHTAYRPSMVFEYHNSEGQLIGYVLRVDFEDGGKMTPQIMWCEWGDGEQGWCHYTFPTPRPLYGVTGLTRNPDAPVMIVEGEKCKDAAHRLLPQYVCLSWAGGTNAVDKADWRSLAGRDTVVIWPDNDEPGLKAADKICEILLDLGVHMVKVIGLDEDKPKGWDVADAEADKMTDKAVVEWAKPRIQTYMKAVEPEPNAEDVPIEAYEEIEQAKQEDAVIDSSDDFRCLGHLDNVFYYLPSRTGEILALTPSKHNKQNLLLLAGSEYWQENFPGKRGVCWDWAYEALLKRGSRMGYFDGHALIRGRGAWIDEGRPLLHLGDRIILDGKEYKPQTVPSRYVYPGGPALPINLTSPASTKEAYKLVDLCNRFVWEKPISGYLLAGWCVIAAVCGILKWRPHIWITGASETGKTTIQHLVCKAMLRGIALECDGNTSEAGVRHALGQDARPIIIDEAEAETQQAKMHMQATLGLARLSSSGGRIRKGTTDGRGISFSIRSGFCWASINPLIEHKADESRISKLILIKDEGNGAQDRWLDLKAALLSTFTKEYAASMFSRTLAHIKTLQANVETFATAANRVFHSARLADQIGTMLAGTYLCHSTKEISISQAVEWINKQDWSDIISVMDKPDDVRLLDTIATSRIRISSDGKFIEATMGELILIADDPQWDGDITYAMAERELRRYGMMVKDGWLWVANRSRPLSRLLRETPWHADWSRSLRDVNGARRAPTRYYSPGINSRGTMIPVVVFKGEEEE